MTHGKPRVLGHHLVHLEQALVYPVVDALASVDTVRRLLEEPGLAGRLGQGALAFAGSRLAWRDSAARLLAFYRTVCGLHPSAGEPQTQTLPAEARP